MNGEIVAVADDLTGALEVGAQFAVSGWSACVSTRMQEMATGRVNALVLDTETRHLGPEKAAKVLRGRVAAAISGGQAKLFKKTDSTLRGNIGSELEAIASLVYGASIVYVPAYPQLGRTVRNGMLYVNGQPLHQTEFACDRYNPAGRSSILETLATQTRMTVRNVAPRDLKRPDEPCILICDGDREEDVAAAAQFISRNDMLIAAGPSALAKELAQLWSPSVRVQPVWPAAATCLIVSGSLHPRSVAQCRAARDAGIPVIAARSSMSDDWALLDTETDVTGEGTVRSEEIGRRVRHVLERSDPDAVLAFGGDTAYGIVKALGEPPLFPIGEAAPGVPVSRISAADFYPQWGRERDLCFLSKAGGFGSDSLVLRLKERLQMQHSETF